MCRGRSVGFRLWALLLSLAVCLSACGRKENTEASREAEARNFSATPQPARDPGVDATAPKSAAAKAINLKGATPQLSPDALPGFPSLVHEAREFSALSDQARKDFEVLQRQFWDDASSDRRLEIIDEVEASCYGEQLLAFAEKLMAMEDESLRVRAVELLAGNTTSEIIPILEKALRDPSDEVRSAAVAAVGQVRDDAVVGFLGKAFEDENPNIRLSGLNVIDAQTEERKLKIFARALEATAVDVQTAAVGALEVESTPRSVEVMFTGLDAADPSVRNEARFSIDFLLDHEFSTAAEARAWWSENKHKFNHDLTPKE